MKRMRGRNHRSNGGGAGGFRNQQNGIPLNRNHVFDSSGPEMRVRGTAQQLYDKYTQLARDASSSGDRVLGEANYQHAEHYFRIVSAINAAQGLPPPGQNGQNGEQRFNNPGQGEFQRREPGAEGEGQENQNREPRQERAEPREYRENREFRDNRENRQDNREYRDNRQENREYRDNRGENNRGENRQDNRGENRQERRYEQRPRQEFQPRERQEFQPRERQDRPFRPTAPIADTPIDISAALEAELRSAQAGEPAGMGEQPSLVAAPAAAPEPRAIPIIPDAPPAPAELTLTEPNAAPAPKRRGRPPRVKPPEDAKAD